MRVTRASTVLDTEGSAVAVGSRVVLAVELAVELAEVAEVVVEEEVGGPRETESVLRAVVCFATLLSGAARVVSETKPAIEAQMLESWMCVPVPEMYLEVWPSI